MSEVLRNLEEKLGYKFTNKSLLNRALTHKSFVNELKKSLEPIEHNEKLDDA